MHTASNEIQNLVAFVGDACPQPTYDRVGNMTTLSNGRALVYDAWNRLVRVIDSDGVTPVAAYEYDGRNFRVIRRSYTSGTLSEVRHFYYTSDWQVVEERAEAAPLPNPTSLTLAAQYVWGLRYVDDLVCRNRDTTSDGTLDERLYALHDANWNVVALAATTGAIVERYTYAPYGAVTYRDSDWFEYAVQDSAYSNTVLYTGRTLDTATSLYYYRARYYDPALERFINRDPIGYKGGMNLYEYVGDAPITSTDPSGTIGESDLKAFWQDGKPSHFPPAPAPTPRTTTTPSGCCGLEIGNQLDTFAGAAKAKFARLLSTSPCLVAKACMTLNTPGGWEINAFFDTSKFVFSSGGCGTDNCRGTVQVHGQCYWASEVNYFWYGLANSLCAQGNKSGQVAAMDLTIMWRYITWWYGDGTTAGRYAWAWAGAHGNTTSVPATASECNNCRHKYDGVLSGYMGSIGILGDNWGITVP